MGMYDEGTPYADAQGCVPYYSCAGGYYGPQCPEDESPWCTGLSGALYSQNCWDIAAGGGLAPYPCCGPPFCTTLTGSCPAETLALQYYFKKYPVNCICETSYNACTHYPPSGYCIRKCTGGCFDSLDTIRTKLGAELNLTASAWLTNICNGSIDPITNTWKKDANGCIIATQKWCDTLNSCIATTATCPQKDSHGCIIGQETWCDTLGKCLSAGVNCPQKDSHGCFVDTEKWCATQVAGIPQEGCIPIGNTCPPARDSRGCLVDSETWCSVKLSCIPKTDTCGLPPAVDEHGCLTDTQKWCNTSSICIGINDTCYIYEPSRDDNGCIIGQEEWCDTLEMCLVAGSSCPSPPPPTVIDEKGCIVGQQKYCDTNSQCIGINDTCPIYEPERDEHGCVVGQQKWCDAAGSCIGVEDTCVVPQPTTAGFNPLLILGVIGVVAVGAMAFGKKNGKAAP